MSWSVSKLVYDYWLMNNDFFWNFMCESVRVGNLLFCSFALLLKKGLLWANPSRLSFSKKSQRERIALAALYKRVAVRKLLSPLFKKSNVSDSFVIRLWFEGIALKKRVIRSKKYVFFICFPTFMPKSDLLSSLLTKDKERPWGNRSRPSLQNINC